MRRVLVSIFIPLIFSCSTQSQEHQSKDEGTWDVYMAMYEKGAGSTTLNMDLVKNAPEKDLPFVVISGVTFTNCRQDGFPNNNEFEKLHDISDNVQNVISKHTKFKLAGTFTYQCERLDYIYVKDTTNLRDILISLYESKYSDYKYYINIKKDDTWDAYLKFLYPNSETQEFMSNQKVIMQLQNGGDNLLEARQVDHWLYFKNINDRNIFEVDIVKIGFKIESKETIDNTTKPFSLHISRVDKVDIESITQVTLDLRNKAMKLNGDYDGWETFIVKK
jgi:regulator of RNase E activity RraB